MRVFTIATNNFPRIVYVASKDTFEEMPEQPFTLIAETEDEHTELMDFIKKHAPKTNTSVDDDTFMED